MMPYPKYNCLYAKKSKEGVMKSYVDELTDLLQEKMNSVKALESENATFKAWNEQLENQLIEARTRIEHMEEQECDTQAEIERLKVQPVRVVDAERLKNQLACFSMSDIIAEMGSGAICEKF